MGEIADYLIEQMMDEGFSPFSGREPRKKRGKPPAKFYRNRELGLDHNGKAVKDQGKPKTREHNVVKAKEYPGKNTPAHLLQDYPEETFNLGFFPKGAPKAVVEPEPVKPTKQRVLRPALPEPGPLWDDLANSDDAPF